MRRRKGLNPDDCKTVISASFISLFVTKTTDAKHANGKTIDVIDGRLSTANSKRTVEECPSVISRSKRLMVRLIQKINVKIDKKKTKL